MPVATGDAFRYITTSGTNVGESDATLIAPDVNGTLTIVGGFGITLTTDAVNRKITITNTGNGTGALTTITTQNSSGTYYPIFTRAPTGGDFNPNSGTYQMSTMYYETTTDPLTYNPGTGTLNVNNLVLGSTGTLSLDGVTSTGVTGTGKLVFSNSPTFTTSIALAYDPLALGNNAGKINQAAYSVAVGTNAGYSNQGGTAVAIGYNAGQNNQVANGIAIGWNAGQTGQGNSSIAIGVSAGSTSQGAYSIALGASAGNGISNPQAANTIIINATNLELDGVANQTNSFYVAPIRNATSSSGVIQYNSSTNEVTYSTTISGATLTGNPIISSGSLTFSGDISAAAWTTSGIRHVSVSATLTDTTSTGTVANAYTNSFGGNTIAASNSVIYTNYATMFVNTPSAGSNVAFTNTWSIITAGNVLVRGSIIDGPATLSAFPSSTTLAIGATSGTTELKGHVKLEGVTSTGATGTGKLVFDTSPTIAGGSHTGITSLGIRDTSAAFDVTLAATSSTTLTAGRTLTVDVVNAARNVKLGGNLTLGAAFTTDANGTISLVTTGNTSITLPTSGTLYGTASGSITATQLATSLSSSYYTGTVGKFVLDTSPTIAGGSHTGITSLGIRDTSAAFDVTLAATSSTTLTAGRTLTVDVVNAARNVKLGGNLTLGAAFTTDANGTISLVTTGNTSITLPTSGTLYGTASGSITSSQLATSISDETGTGALVFGTNPSLTAPTWGNSSNTTDADYTFDASAYGYSSWIVSFTAPRNLNISNLTVGRRAVIYIRNTNASTRAITINASTTTTGFTAVNLAVGAGAVSSTSVTLAATSGTAVVYVWNAGGNLVGMVN